MKKIEAYIRTEKLGEIKGILVQHNLSGVTISQVMGCGTQKGWTGFVRGTEVDYNFLNKLKIEMVLLDEQVEPVVESIIEVDSTGEFGDGKIFIYNVEDAIRIRTKERGIAAIQ